MIFLLIFRKIFIIYPKKRNRKTSISIETQKGQIIIKNGGIIVKPAKTDNRQAGM